MKKVSHWHVGLLVYIFSIFAFIVHDYTAFIIFIIITCISFILEIIEINKERKEGVENMTKKANKIKQKLSPKIINLVKSKMFKYSAGFIYLFAFVILIAGYWGMFFILAFVSFVLIVLSVIYDIKFVFDNLR